MEYKNSLNITSDEIANIAENMVENILPSSDREYDIVNQALMLLENHIEQ